MPAIQRSFPKERPFEIGFLLRPARRGDDVPTALREKRDRNRSHTAGGSGDDDRSFGGFEAVLFEREQAEHRRISGRADRHRLSRREIFRQRHEPFTLDACVACITAEMRFAEPPAVQDDGIARPPISMARGLDDARKIDAGDHGKASHHGSLAGERESVLVIDGRVTDTHEDVALHEGVEAKFLQSNALARIRLLDQDGLELHSLLLDMPA
jgi:hypothetical protein